MSVTTETAPTKPKKVKKEVPKDIHFFHFKPMRHLGMVTAAYKLDPHRDAKERVITYALCYCAPGDKFSKEIGRTRTVGRLNSPNFARQGTIVRDEELGFYHQITLFLTNAALESLPAAWRNGKYTK